MKKHFFLSITLTTLALLAKAQQDTTAFMRTLTNLPSIKNVERIESKYYSEKYVMNITQNVDGDTDEKGTFQQRIVVGFRGYDRPTIIVTEGYYGDYGLNPRYKEELCDILNANLVFCEYRYFGPSTPTPTNWEYMTVDNSLRDYHHIRQELGKVFKGKWVSTGISKGGQTTMFYRATYPEDMDISVSYVAPLNKAVEDGRHETFLSKKVGTKAERKAIVKAQKEFMKRKQNCMPLFHKYNEEHGYKFYISEEDIYDYTVLEYPFALWQWGTPLSNIPSTDQSDEMWFNHLMKIADPDYFAYPNKYVPFDYQAARELGYYGYDTKPIRKWMSIKSTKGYLKEIMLPDSLRNVDFDPTLYNRTVKYLKENDPKHIFIYGANDPWSASGVCTWLDCSKKENMKIYVQPKGSHTARILNMPDDIKMEIVEKLTKWINQ